MQNIHLYLLLLLLSVAACTPSPQVAPNNENKVEEDKTPKNQQVSEFETILDSNRLKGAILIFDPSRNVYYSNDFERCKTGYLPASTYKIVNSIIGLETAAVDTNYIFKWDGKARRLKSWNKDMNLHGAYHASCVPCYQELARKIGVERMNDYLQKFDYGKMVVNDTTLDKFWLEGDSRISPMQQIDFLIKLQGKQLPIAENTYKIMQYLMLLAENDAYKLYGKTGWSIRDGFNVGWFVGWFQLSDKVVFVATNVEPLADFDMDNFGKVRLQVSLDAFELLKKQASK